jgi:hypothetical protein
VGVSGEARMSVGEFASEVGADFYSLLASGSVGPLGYFDNTPHRPVASVGYPEAGESLIRRIAQRRLLTIGT